MTLSVKDRGPSSPWAVAREAAGLASWLTRLQGRTDEAALRELIAPFIADDTQGQLDEDGEDLLDDDSDDLDDTDIFVQVKVARFLEAAGLPAPRGLPC